MTGKQVCLELSYKPLLFQPKFYKLNTGWTAQMKNEMFEFKSAITVTCIPNLKMLPSKTYNQKREKESNIFILITRKRNILDRLGWSKYISRMNFIRF